MKIYQATLEGDFEAIRTLFLEYMTWAVARLDEEYSLELVDDPVAYVDGDMAKIKQFMPPEGHLLLAEIEGKLAGIACMRRLAPDILEIKRMYVRPEFRKLGIGRALVQALLDIAKESNTSTVRLDSSRFMEPAHALYRSFGFSEIDPYEGSEIPPEIQQYWIFMELHLD